jgi:MFS family permease
MKEEVVVIKSDIEPRLDRLPWSAWHTKVTFAVGFAWFLDSLEASIIGSVLGILKKIWAFTPFQGSLTVSVWLIGIMVGAVVFGYFSDRYGRKPIFILTLLWYSFFTLLCAFSTNIWIFIFLRFMAAVGIGGEYAAVSSIVVEFIPKKTRGRINAFIMSMWPLGAIGSALLVMFVVKLFPTSLAWRFGFLLAVVLSIFALVIRRYVPESPRWLKDRGRNDAAEAVVGTAEKEVMRLKGLSDLPSVEPISLERRTQTVFQQTRELFTTYPLRIFIGSSMNFAQVALGYGSIAYASLVLFPMTKTPPEDVPFYFMIAFTCAFLGGLTSMALVDTLGRKVSALLSYFSYFPAILSMLWVDSPKTALLSLCLMQYAYTWGWVTEYVIKSEIFPTRIRAAGIGWATFFGRIGGIIAAPILAATYEATRSIGSVSWVLCLIVAPGFIGSCLWAAKGIEGRQKALEELVAKD